jgi:hypothetical protein
MSDSASLPAERSRFTWLERRGDDFPYCNGRPVEITGSQWWLVTVSILGADLARGQAS